MEVEKVTNREFALEKHKLELRNKKIAQRLELEELKNKYKKKRKKPTMSKVILLLVLFFCLEIAVFAEVYMWHFADSAALYSLIGIPVALMPVVVAYFRKSKAENTVGGIVYDMAVSESTDKEETTSNAVG